MYKPILPCAARAASELGVLLHWECSLWANLRTPGEGARASPVAREFRAQRACKLSKYGISSAEFGPHHPASFPSQQPQ